MPPHETIEILNSAILKPPQESPTLRIAVAFIFIIIGGVCLSVGVITRLKWLYWTGIGILLADGIFMAIQSSRLNSPCSLA